VRGALVSADGTIDWYSPDAIGAAPLCWSLIDPAGGALRVGPVREASDAGRRLPGHIQRYRPGTNVLETVLAGARGRQVSILDALPWPGPGRPLPGVLVRVVRALSGPVDVEIEVVPGGPFGAPRQVSPFDGGLVIDRSVIRTGGGVELTSQPLGRDRPRWRGVGRLLEGETMVVTIGQVDDGEVLSPDGAMRLIEETETAWRSWLAPLAYSGAYARAVERSGLVVRSLTGSGGGPCAAGTTSLPRRDGSERTADDRWVRWRDAATAVGGWAALGLPEDAEAAEHWLKVAALGAPLPWPGALDPDGQPVPDREELSLAGRRRSQPVVAGRSPELRDLDLYGDVLAAYGASTRGLGGAGGVAPLADAMPALSEAADWVADHWAAPDSGVWETPGPPAALVASRVQAWFALDRMARLARAANPLDLQAAAWQDESRRVIRWLEAYGLADDGGLRRAAGGEGGEGGEGGGDDEPDAALLRVAWRGPWPVAHPVVPATVDRVLDRLGSEGLIYRHSERVDDGLAGLDQPDLLASLWAVRALAVLGRWEEAHERMEAVLRFGGDGADESPGLGVLSEAADPLTGELLGNLPSASTHLAVVEAALALEAGPR
jgi:alpha,alpha-trehalase